MIPTVVYDANVLYPSTLRDVLIRVGIEHLAVPRWTDQILDETFRNLAANRPDLSTVRLMRTRALMNAAIPDVLVTGYERHLDAVTLPDPEDHHVVAAALHASASMIVTKNLHDFPEHALTPHGLTAIHPDAFLTDLTARHPDTLAQIVRQIAHAWRANPSTAAGLDSLAVEAPETAARLRATLQPE